MNTEVETGGPAFPFTELNGDGSPYCQHLGLTMRDYFAATAMQGMLSSFEHWRRYGEIEHVTKTAYYAADEMLKARMATNIKEQI